VRSDLPEKLGRHPEHALDQSDLADDIALRYPANLTFADDGSSPHILQSYSGAIEGSKPLASYYTVLYEAMVRFEDVIEVGSSSTAIVVTAE